MPTISAESLVIALILVVGMVNARPKVTRRFCANYPFAPKCLGVAAKRSEESSQINRNGLADYSNIETILIRSPEEKDIQDQWETNDDVDEDVDSAVILPYNILSKIIDKKAAQRQMRRRSNVWEEFEDGRE